MEQPAFYKLESAALEQVIDQGRSLLQQPGVKVLSQDALARLDAAGARIDWQKQIARIPAELIDRSLEAAPSEFHLYDLSGKPVVHYGGNHVHFDPGSAAVMVLDTASGKQRPAASRDLLNFYKVVEELPQLDAQSTAIVCQDVPSQISDLYRLYLALITMRKPIVTGAFRAQTWHTMYELLVTIAGGEAELAAKPVAIFDACPTPPLQWTDPALQNLLDCAQKRVPAQLVSMPLAGITSPVTLYSAVVQHTAESLSGVVLSQIVQPGTPIVWGGAPAATDMRYGTTPMGDASTWLIDMACIQVGKALGLPTHTYMGSSDSKLIDAQGGLESAGGTLLAALSGANMVSGAGMLDFLRCQSLEKLVIDAEIIGMVKHLQRGISLDEAQNAFELMRASPHQADFLAHTHTNRWFRQELYIPSRLIDRRSYESWQRQGGESMLMRAAEQVTHLLNKYQPFPLDERMRDELRRITALSAQPYGMEQLPALPQVE